MRPTTALSADTSKSSAFHSPEGREPEARLRMRRSGGGLEVYDIRNNQITSAAFLGTVGFGWELPASARSTVPARPT
jgi:hypothetical protein